LRIPAHKNLDLSVTVAKAIDAASGANLAVCIRPRIGRRRALETPAAGQAPSVAGGQTLEDEPDILAGVGDLRAQARS
jgi:hypothetical protein